MRLRVMWMNALVLLVGMLGYPALGSAQTDSAGGPVPAVALKRAADAVTALGGGAGPYWVVYDCRPPYNVLTIFDNPAAANQYAHTHHFCVTGPITPDPQLRDQQGLVLVQATPGGGGCKSGASRCDSMAASVFAPKSSVVEMQLQVRLRDGRTFVTRLDPDSVEVLVFTLAGLDKLIVPYYASTVGVEYAAEIRRGFLEAMEHNAMRGYH